MKIEKIAIYILFILCVLESCSLVRLRRFNKTLSEKFAPSITFYKTFKFRLKNDRIIIRVKFNGSDEEEDFLLDTGGMCVIPFEYKTNHKIEASKLMKLGKNRYESSTATINLEGIQYNTVPVLISDDFNTILESTGTSGIIGVSLLKDCIWQFNFSDTTITFTNEKKILENMNEENKIPFKQYKSQGIPIITLSSSADQNIEAFIDTGNPYTLSLNDKIVSESNYKTATSYFNYNRFALEKLKDSLYTTKYIQFTSLKSGNYTIDTLIASQQEDYKGRNLIGMDFLRNYTVTIDWMDNNLYLDKQKVNSQYKDIYSYGFDCSFTGGRLIVFNVFKDSKAEKLGIASGDEIISINNVKKEDFSTIPEIIEAINDSAPYSDSLVILTNKFVSPIILSKESIFKGK